MEAIAGSRSGKHASLQQAISSMHETGLPSDYVNFAGYDYLGLARDSRSVEALCQAAHQYGISCTSSRWAVGWTDVHERLERELADFFGTQRACLMGKGFLGGPAFFATAADHADTVYCDQLSHSNLVLGIRAAGLRLVVYRHLDAGDLSDQLRRHRGAPPIVATDSVFSISGEVAPLAEIDQLARASNASLLIDEAHAVFTMGPSGRGAAEAAGIRPEDFTLQGGLGKALGADGGFLAGRHGPMLAARHSPGPSGSADPPTPIAAAALAALEIVRTEPERRAALQRHARSMRSILAEHGIAVVSAASPIVTLQMRDQQQAQQLAQHFLGYRIRIPYFKYASEPRGNLLRAVARSCYTEEQLNRFRQAVRGWSARTTDSS